MLGFHLVAGRRDSLVLCRSRAFCTPKPATGVHPLRRNTRYLLLRGLPISSAGEEAMTIPLSPLPPLAQPASAFGLGPKGRGFKSHHPDHSRGDVRLTLLRTHAQQDFSLDPSPFPACLPIFTNQFRCRYLWVYSFVPQMKIIQIQRTLAKEETSKSLISSYLNLS